MKKASTYPHPSHPYPPQYSASYTAQQQHIMREFGGNVYEPAHMDVQEGRLWDCLTLNHNAAFVRHKFFVVPNGNEGKTYADTNLDQCARLNPPEAFAVKRIVFSFSKSSDPSDVAELAEACHWSLVLNNRYLVRSMMIHMRTFNVDVSAPFRICDFCKSVYVGDRTCPGCGARQFCITSVGDDKPASIGLQFVLDLSVNIIIHNQMSFHVQMDASHIITLRSPLKLWVHLEGLHARGVQ